MNRVETRVQLLMAVVGSFLALAVLTPQLFAEDPLPAGSNYIYDPNLTWIVGTGAAASQAGKICIQQAPCLTLNACFTPYNVNFGGVQYQSGKDVEDLNYGLCQVPLPGTNPGPDCAQLPTVPCSKCRLYTQQNCGGSNLIEKTVYRLNACSVN